MRPMVARVAASYVHFHVGAGHAREQKGTAKVPFLVPERQIGGIQ